MIRRLRGVSEWDFMIRKELDESVSSTTLQNDDTLFWTMKSGEMWRFRLMLSYVGDATGDFKWDWVVSTSTAIWTYRNMGESTSNASTVLTDHEPAVASSVDAAIGGGTVTILRRYLTDGFVTAGADQVCNFRFARNGASGAAICKAGTILLLKRLGQLS